MLSQAAQTNGDLTPEQIIAAIGVYCPHAHCAMKCLFMLICLMCLVAHGCRSLLGSSLANSGCSSCDLVHSELFSICPYVCTAPLPVCSTPVLLLLNAHVLPFVLSCPAYMLTTLLLLNWFCLWSVLSVCLSRHLLIDPMTSI